MGYMAAMAAAKGVSSGLNWLMNRRTDKFDDTAYGKRLKARMETGMYTPTAMSRIVGGVSKTTGNAAQTARASYKGRLINRGMEGSIAGQGEMNRIEADRIDKLADVSERLETQNEMSKERYADEYAQAKTNYAEKIKEWNRQNNANLVSGVVDAAGTYVQGKMQKPLQDAKVAREEAYTSYLNRRDASENNVQLSQFMSADGGFDENKIMTYAKTLSPNEAQKFIDEMINMGAIRDWKGF